MYRVTINAATAKVAAPYIGIAASLGPARPTLKAMTAAILTRGLVIGAIILGGLLAGETVDKSVVQLPSWRQIGPVTWEEFTRSADRGRQLIFLSGAGNWSSFMQ